MKRFELFTYGNMNANKILVQAVDEHDMEVIESEFEKIQEISKLSREDFGLLAIKVEDWNRDLSPWEAPPVFGKEPFGGEAAETLSSIRETLSQCFENYDTDNDINNNLNNKKFYIGGYSLAGLFAIWAACNTDLFSGVAAASPSVWYPGFSEYLKTVSLTTQAVYLSLGDREEQTRNQVMAKVGNCIRDAYAILKNKGIHCTLEWNEGNHFRDSDLRTAKAFAWLLTRDQQS